ncbi:MAG: S1C family serine protease [Planctomycetota bacterium]
MKAGEGTRSSYRFLWAALAAVAIWAGCSSVQTNDPAPALIEKLSRACVEVLADGQLAGSGAFVSSDGYALTAAHFIASPEMKLEVLSTGAVRHAATLIAIDKGHDIALLKVEAEKEFAFLPVNRRTPQAGQAVYVVGSPLNRHGLLLQGVVASRHPDYEYLTDQAAYLCVWYVATMAPRGLSGGNWVNAAGEIVGVQSGWVNEQIPGTDGTVNSGITFVAGPEAIGRLVETQKHADTPSIGGIVEELWTQAPGFQRRFEEGTEGIVIHQVRPDGPLEKAGLGHEDAIVSVDGKKVRYRKELMDIVRGKKVGDQLEIGFVKPDNKGTGEKIIVLDGLERNWLKPNAAKNEKK